MNKGSVIAGLVFLVLVAGGTFALTSNSKDKVNGTKSSQSSSKSTDTSSDAASDDKASSSAVTITYDGTTFTPNTVSVKSGDMVTVKNASASADLDFDSDPHPVHTDDTDLNAGEIDPGKSKTFTVTKKGAFGYHNHEDPSQHGNITIE